jgi:hypothetical protein
MERTKLVASENELLNSKWENDCLLLASLEKTIIKAPVDVFRRRPAETLHNRPPL